MQKEAPNVQVPASPHNPEQQSRLSRQALPAVLQEEFSVPQAPSIQAPLQHSESVMHSSASEVQAAAEHLPSPPQCRLQQSVALAHFSPAIAQVPSPTTEAQALVFGSQTPEQQSALSTQISLKVLQLGPPGSPAPPTPTDPPRDVSPAPGRPVAPLSFAPPLARVAPDPLSPASPLLAPASALAPPGAPFPSDSDDPQAEPIQTTAVSVATRLPTRRMLKAPRLGQQMAKLTRG